MYTILTSSILFQLYFNYLIGLVMLLTLTSTTLSTM